MKKYSIMENIGRFWMELIPGIPLVHLSKVVPENFKISLSIAAMAVFASACYRAYKRASQ